LIELTRSQRRPSSISTVSPFVTAGFNACAAVAKTTLQRMQDVSLVNGQVAGIVLG
jgi:hypothetical protein